MPETTTDPGRYLDVINRILSIYLKYETVKVIIANGRVDADDGAIRDGGRGFENSMVFFFTRTL